MTRAVIFDMDGVLVLSVDAHWQAWSAVAAEQGAALSREDFFGFNGLTNPDICRRLFGADAPVERLQAIAESKERAFRSAIAGAVPLAPGVRELLATLRARGARLAVGSSAPEQNVDAILDGGAIRDCFDAVVHADMVARGKPAPDIFLRAAALLGARPAECVVIEDAPSGIVAAKAAGIRAVAVATNHAPAELTAAGAAHVAASLRDVPLDWLLP